MKKKRPCRQCGAMNTGDRYKCRLCGHVLDTPEAFGVDLKKPPRGVITDKPKYSVNILIFFGATVVAVLVGAGIYFGLIRNEYIDTTIAIVQNQRDSQIRGWVEVAPEESGVVVSLPGAAENIEETKDALPATLMSGSMLSNGFDQYDTAYVAWGRLGVPTADSDTATLERLAQAYASDRGGDARNITLGEKSGKPAVFFDVVYRSADPLFTKAFIILDGEWAAVGAVDSSTESFPLYETFIQQYSVVPVDR